MTTYFKYFAAAAFAMLLCSCDKEITLDTVESQVQISANITPCLVTRVTDEGTSFTNGDAIKVQNINRESKNLATYTYSESTGKWSTSDELYWDGESANTFNAWYPAIAQYSSFTIPSDQSAGTATADWMTATASAKKADDNVQLSFNHNLAKVTVLIESWSNEYAANEKVVNSLELNSLSSVISYNGTISGDNAAKWVNTYPAQSNVSYVAIVAPATYNTATDIIQVYVNGASEPLKVKTTSSVVVESGKAYTFKLTVGKNLATITSSVSVGAWDDYVLDDQQAGVVTSQNEYIDEYGVNHGEGVEIDGVVWAPVNCGYHATDYKYGKLYQWGRKYGQGYNSSDASVPSIVAGPVSLSTGQSASNSNKFYTSSDSYTPWLSPADFTLWNGGTESNPQKTEYDPCPDGWRVPTENELENLTISRSSWIINNDQSGYWFCGSNSYSESVSCVFLPAAGSRDNSGLSSGRESAGDYWSSSTSGALGVYVEFYKNSSSSVSIRILDTSCGYSVRCVKE